MQSGDSGWNDPSVPDYELTRLGSRAFEQPVVSLCRRSKEMLRLAEGEVSVQASMPVAVSAAGDR